ncbi:hypothetical protein GYMLUDRAFT_63508 [Collybiopsis luxurians FD-317 M1]|uniref:Uncharacterized protein n=1 Tax=Collybiopsis luxurians FD-317 M1 TaxID=944289 RepID=A0A0D0BGK3_9AGAR|nr:hypothetical protein GYMLUDRAFT_63508 [Collybiopsis luxurians FD-317 M1]
MARNQTQSSCPPTLNDCPKISVVKFSMNAPTWSRLQTRIFDGSSSNFPIRILSTEITEGQICSVNLRKSGIPDGSLIQLGCDFICELYGRSLGECAKKSSISSKDPCWISHKIFLIDYCNGGEIETSLYSIGSKSTAMTIPDSKDAVAKRTSPPHTVTRTCIRQIFGYFDSKDGRSTLHVCRFHAEFPYQNN